MLKLLIADDEALERRALRSFVEDLPEVTVVGEAGNGPETVLLAERTHPDLALVDIKMPGLTGLEAIREMAAVSPGTRSIIVTAYEDFQYAQEALRLGAIDYLLKPAPREVVQRVVLRAADRKEQEAERTYSQVQARIRSSLPLIQTALVLDLISGAEPDRDELEAHAALVGMKQLPTVALSISPDQPPRPPWRDQDNQRAAVRNALYGAVSAALAEREGYLAIPMGGEELAVVVAPPHDGLVDLLRLAKELQAICVNAVGESFTVGIGRRAANPMELSTSYQEALAAVRYSRMILGCDRVIHIDEVTPALPVGDPAQLDLEREAADRLRWGDREGTAAAIERLLAVYLGPRGFIPETFRLRVTELVVILSRAAMDGGADPERVSEVTSEAVWTLLYSRTADHCRKCLQEATEGFLALLEQKYTCTSERVVRQVLDYVKEHYAEPISVADVASRLFVNPSYFCRSFKRVTGSTFIEYLTRLRLERARQLLATTDEPVAAVGRMVGFHDANYFSRVFTRHYDCAPGEFRRRVSQPVAL